MKPCAEDTYNLLLNIVFGLFICYDTSPYMLCTRICKHIRFIMSKTKPV